MVPVVMLVLFLAIAVPFLSAQQTTATIIGKVIDEASEEPILEATLSAENLSGGGIITRNANKKGKFRFNSISPGAYRLTIKHEGYELKVVSCVINAAQTLNLKITMKKSSAEKESQNSGTALPHTFF